MSTKEIAELVCIGIAVVALVVALIFQIIATREYKKIQQNLEKISEENRRRER